jgi:hypothetical protein
LLYLIVRLELHLLDLFVQLHNLVAKILDLHILLDLLLSVLCNLLLRCLQLLLGIELFSLERAMELTALMFNQVI